jgi:hypothetical protein
MLPGREGKAACEEGDTDHADERPAQRLIPGIVEESEDAFHELHLHSSLRRAQ